MLAVMILIAVAVGLILFDIGYGVGCQDGPERRTWVPWAGNTGWWLLFVACGIAGGLAVH